MQAQLGYHFSDTQYLYDALNISGQLREATEIEHPQDFIRNRKVYMGTARVKMAIANNAFMGDKTGEWDESSLTRAVNLWRQTNVFTRIAEELELGDLMLRKRRQIPQNSTMVSTFFALVEAISDDIHAQGGTDNQVLEKINQIVDKFMPAISSIAGVKPVSLNKEAKNPVNDIDIMNKLEQSKEFIQRGLSFVWGETKSEYLNNKRTEVHRTLSLVQRMPGQEPVTIIEIPTKVPVEKDQEDKGESFVTQRATRLMMNAIMEKHYFIEIIRNLATGRDGYANEIPVER